jgi:hypothetical protein
MPSKGFEIMSPVKGVNKNLAWADRTPEWAIDALNVLPYDLEGRQRLTQRSGTSGLYAAAPGTGDVQFLGQTTTPVTGAVGGFDNILFQPAVTPQRFANAQRMDASPPGLFWLTSADNAFDAALLTTPDATVDVHIDAGGARNFVNGFSDAPHSQVVAHYAGTMNTAGPYAVQAAWTNVNQAAYSFFLRLNPSASAGNKYVAISIVWVASNQVVLVAQHDLGSIWSTVITQTTSGTKTLRAEVNGNHFKLYLNGVLQLEFDSAAGAGNSGVGVVMSGYHPDANPLYTTNDRLIQFVVDSATVATGRKNNLILVTGGNILQGTLASAATVTNGTSALSSTGKPQGTASTGKMYFVDGSATLALDVATATASNLVASAGSIPAGCKLAAMYRDRLVLAAPAATPQNFFCSRVGTHTDFDYSQTDPAAAFAGNASVAGRIGDPITALIPATEDIMLIGGDHTLHAMRGDPADGGSIDLISDTVGVLGPNAWTKAPDGTIFFVGTGGLYQMAPGGSPTDLTAGVWGEFFRTIDRTTNWITLAYDRDRHGLYVFVTPATAGTATHLWWDARSGGLWPIQFPNDTGPISALVYDGDGPADRVTLLGGRDGDVRKMALTDGGDGATAINSYALIGPYKTSDIQERTIQWMDLILGEPASFHTVSDWKVRVEMRAASTVEKAVNSPDHTAVRTITGKARRQTRWQTRLRGNAFVLKLSNSDVDRTWAFERLSALFLPSGTVRRV